MKQTAVDWFFDNLKNHEVQAEHLALYEKAKKMEKKQMIDFAFAFSKDYTTAKEMRDYYNETFNANEK